MVRVETNRQLATSLVLVDDNEAVFNLIAALVDPSYVIHWYKQVEEAIAWVRDRPSTALILINTDQSTAHSLTQLRSVTADQSIPLLLLCEQPSDAAVQLALKAGATDLLSLTDTVQLERRIQFFLTLMRRVSAQPDGATGPTRPFRLPAWKRAIDITASFLALVLLSPLLLLTALLIKLDSQGPVFYTSKRVGTNYKVFGMIKFRTMRVAADQLLKQMASENNMYSEAATPSAALPTQSLCEACRLMGTSCQRKLFDQDRFVCERDYLQREEKGAAFVKFRNDPRITRLGNFLRNSSIDELPQLINILLGHMSLVGNRPLPVYEAEKLTTDEAIKRFAGPSGLTGLWQVKKRARGAGKMNEQERIQLDIEYVDTFSFRNDITIIYKTFFSLWQQENV